MQLGDVNVLVCMHTHTHQKHQFSLAHLFEFVTFFLFRFSCYFVNIYRIYGLACCAKGFQTLLFLIVACLVLFVCACVSICLVDRSRCRCCSRRSRYHHHSECFSLNLLLLLLLLQLLLLPSMRLTHENESAHSHSQSKPKRYTFYFICRFVIISWFRHFTCQLNYGRWQVAAGCN